MLSSVFLIFVALIVFDYIYLIFMKGPFGEMIVKIQRVAMQVRVWSALMVYVAAAILLYWFIIKNRKPVWEAGLLGLATYAIFDFTNYALLKNYDLKIAIIDSVWGAILFSSITWIYYRVLNR